MLLLMSLLMLRGGVFAQVMQTTQGRDFWVGFLHNGNCDYYQADGQTLAQAVAANQWTLVASSEGEGSVTATCGGWSTAVNLVPGGSVTINVPYETTTTFLTRWTRPCYSRQIRPAGIHVTATTDISLYAYNYSPASFDATTVLPTQCLGKHYIVNDFNYYTQPGIIMLPDTYDGGEMCIVATENNTTVDIEFHSTVQIDTFAFLTSAWQTSSHSTHSSGSHFRSLTLQQGQYLQLITPGRYSFAGTEITADKPIAVFTGRKRTVVPYARDAAGNISTSRCCADHLYEQAIPTDRWGREFVIVPDHRTTNPHRSYFDIVSLEDNCTVTCHTSSGTTITIPTLSAYENYLGPMSSDNSPIFINASKPVSVCLYLGSNRFCGNEGDPSSVIIPPIDQGTNRSVFFAFDNLGFSHRTNIVVPTAAVEGMKIDGTDISSQFNPIGTTALSYARISITSGIHTITNLQGRFNAWFYGMAGAGSYAYTAAMGLRNLHYELFVDGDNAHTWGDTIPVCVGTPHHFKIETDGETETRWFVDGTPQTSTDTAMDCTFTSLGIHSMIALQRGDCADPDFCDTLRLAVHVGGPAATTLTRRVYADSLPLSVNGIEYSSPGTYTQTLTTTHGCDSTLTLNVVVVPHGFDDYVVTAPATPVAFYPTLNDTQPCDDAVFSIVTMPVHGNVASCYGAGNNEGHRDDLDELLGDGGGEGVDGPAPVPCLVYTPESTLGGEFGEPPTQYIGADSLRVAVCCGEECDTSWVHITVTPLPDNIVEADCTVPADSNSFEMQELFHTAYDEVVSLSTPMVADVDGDGLPEIVACRYYNSTNNNYNLYFSNGIVIYNGQTGVKKYEFIVSRDYSLSGQGVVVADVDEDGKAEFFILTSDRYILCYSYSPSDDNWTLKWMSDQMDLLQIPTVVDLMGDGNKQVVCGSWIFNAQNGTLLLQGTTESDGTGFFQLVNTCHLGYSPYLCAVGDIDGDGRLEVCGGRALYKPTLTNYSGTTGNTWTLLRKAAAGSGIVNYDGETFLLDFDGDGDLDICVVGTPPISCSAASTRFDIYAWEGQNTDIVANASYTMTTRYGPTIAYCGDLDGNGAPEILFALDNTNGNALEGGMMAYTYDPAVTGNMRLMHQYTPFSETAGFTVFDFNQDGHNEIVYRGIRQLYIVDGTTLNPLCSPLTAYNPTHREYPIVADVNGDGHAEILVARSQYDYYYDYYNYSDTTRFRGAKGCIAVYGSAIPGAWSSARKVWNQYAYTPVGINEDLSVPQHPLNPATRFANGSQPYNRFLGQVPYITPQGDMFNLAPDAVALSTTAEIDGDDFNITLSLGNQGDNTLNAPYGITLYKDSYRGEVLHIETVNADLPVSDNSSTITITLPRSTVCALADVDTLVVALNDAGTGIAQHGAQQAECDTTNNTLKVAVPHNNGNTVYDTVYDVDLPKVYNGESYYMPVADALHHLAAATGCDSIVHYNLHVNHPALCAGGASTGRDFWVGFLHNGEQDRLMSENGYSWLQAENADTLLLKATAATACTVTASCGNWSSTVNVAAGASAVIQVPFLDGTDTIAHWTRPGYSRRILPAGIHVTSTADIGLQAFNHMNLSGDATTVLPTPSLGTYYRLHTDPSGNHPDILANPYDGGEFCIVATEDNTLVRIRFDSTAYVDTFALGPYAYNTHPSGYSTYPPRSTFRTLDMQQGDYIQLLSPSSNLHGSFTGAEVLSDKPVAVFMGSKYTEVPFSRTADGNYTYPYPDHLYEQAIPTSTWGTDFLVVPDARIRHHWDYFGILSNDDDNTVYFTRDPAVPANQSAGPLQLRRGQLALWNIYDYYDSDGRLAPIYVHSTKPIAVYLYLSGGKFREGGGESNGDPSVVYIPPLSQGTHSATFNVANIGLATQHHASVVVPSATVASMRLDGNDISSFFTPFLATGYSHAQIPIAQGTHTLGNAQGRFVAWVYGFGPRESYAFTAAATLCKTVNEWSVGGLYRHHRSDTLAFCPGDTLLFSVSPAIGYDSIAWYLDGAPLPTAHPSPFSLRLPLPPSAGNHLVTALLVARQTPPFRYDTLSILLLNNSSPRTVEGTSPSLFSVSPTRRVRFSPGNIQFQASTGTWRFAPHQYDCIADANANISSTYSGWIDLFAYGTSGWNSGATAFIPSSTSTDDLDYRPGGNYSNTLTASFAEADWAWHNPLSGGGNQPHLWRTLSSDEWTYLLTLRDSASLKLASATVAGIHGTIILPDHWIPPAAITLLPGTNGWDANSYSAAQWDLLQAAGAIFLPAAGNRGLAQPNSVGVYGQYWSVSNNGAETASSLLLAPSAVNPAYPVNRHYGLSVRPVYDVLTDTVASACGSFTWYDSTYTRSTSSATHTLLNAAGCDSTVTLHLTILNPTSSTDRQTACDSYTWIDGNTYTASNNTATFTFVNAAGCDSVVTLDLTVNHSNTGTETVTACDTYTWIDGNTYTTSNNTATFTLTNAAGCDSVVTLNLTVNQATDSTLTLLAFPSEMPVTVNGTPYGDFGYYQQHLTNAAGCDSVLNVHLVPYPDNVEDAACTVGVDASPWDAHVVSQTNYTVHTYLFPCGGRP